MPKFPKPWYRENRGWYVTFDGHQVPLGSDRKEAFLRYHALMAEPRKRQVPSESILALIDRFLEFVHQHRAPDTYEWYRSRLQLFAKRYPELTTAQLRPIHVQEWIDSFPHLSSGSKRNHARAIQRCLKWAEEMGIVDRSPIAHFKKPRGGKREQVISDAEWHDLLEGVPDPDFRDLLTVTWETGCRPQESLRVEARHVDLANSRWVFPESESKTGTPRFIYLTVSALDITRRMMLRHPTGKLFRNRDGSPWTTEAVNCAFIRIQIRQGIARMRERGIEITKEEIAKVLGTLKQERRKNGKLVRKTAGDLRDEARQKVRYKKARELGTKYCLYAIRHTWINRLLTSGVDALTVAILAGHRDPSMLAKTYQHLSQNPAFLLSQARKAAS